jgi:hypothetical protein
MIRRFIYDTRIGAVVELGSHTVAVSRPGDDFKEAKLQHQKEQNESAGQKLREAALEIADRRVWAHNRFGNEANWRE